MSAVALVTDLMFISKIKGTAASLGIPLSVHRTADQIEQTLSETVRLAIIDMNSAGSDPVGAIQRCCKTPHRPFIIAFLSHVQKELSEAAKAAGADLVIPRSVFSRDLPQLLQQYSNPTR